MTAMSHEQNPPPLDDEPLSDFEIFTYKLHWIVLYQEDQDRIEELEALYDRLSEGKGTENDEDQLDEIASSVWDHYDPILDFERLDIIPDDDIELNNLVYRMVFLAIIDHIFAQETDPQKAKDEDALAPYIELSREFLEKAKDDPGSAYGWLDGTLRENEEGFLKSTYFAHDKDN